MFNSRTTWHPLNQEKLEANFAEEEQQVAETKYDPSDLGDDEEDRPHSTRPPRKLPAWREEGRAPTPAELREAREQRRDESQDRQRQQAAQKRHEARERRHDRLNRRHNNRDAGHRCDQVTRDNVPESRGR